MGVGQFAEVEFFKKAEPPTQPLQPSQPQIEHNYPLPEKSPDEIIKEKDEEIKRLNSLLAARDRRISLLTKTIHEMKNGKVPKRTQEIVCREKLKRKMPAASIDFYISEKPRKRIRNAESGHCALAYKLLCKAGKKGFRFVQNEVMAMPGYSTLHQKFGFLSVRSGFFKHVFTYIKMHLSQTDSWKYGKGFLGVFAFDEVSLAKLALYCKKFDCIIGKLTYFAFLQNCDKDFL